MKLKYYAKFSMYIFGTVGFLSLLRIFTGWPITVNGSWEIPMWVSVFVVGVCCYMVWQAHQFTRK